MTRKGLTTTGILVSAVLAWPAAALASGIDSDHWSFFNLVIPDAAMENLRNLWGKTWLFGDHVGRTMHVVMGVVVVLVALLLTAAAGRRFRQQGDEAVLPERSFGLFTVFELVAEWLLNMMTETMGRKHARYFFPLIMSFAIFIFVSNALGLVPGLLSATDNLNTTMALALVTFAVTHVYGVREHGFVKYFAHFLGPIRKWYALPLMILMFFIEIISHFARPLSLAIRLMGNMLGDHQVLLAFLGFGIVLVPLPVMVLALIVVTVQTLVFCLLSVVYIGMAVEHAEEH